MYRNLISRMLVVALMIALVAKPCFGLLTSPAEAANFVVSAFDLDISTYDETNKCKGKCLSGRVEEVAPAASPAKAAASNGNDQTKFIGIGDIEAWRAWRRARITKYTGPDEPGLRKRLTTLSRFLL
jgi:hypothetical protein